MIDAIKLINRELNQELNINKTDFDSDYILESVDFGQVKGSHKTYKGIYQIGETLQGTTLETRSVSIVGWIVAENDDLLTILRKKLNMLVNPLQAIRIEYKDYYLNMFPDESISYSRDYKENNEVMCKFMIQGTCTFPLFGDKEDELLKVATTESTFMFPLTIKEEGITLGIRKPSLITNVVNKGTIETGFILKFKALGTLLNPSLTNINTQETFKINKEMKAGEEIIINSNDGEKTIQGYLNGVEENYFKYKDVDSDWLRLALGDNLFRYNAEDNVSALEVEIIHNNKYLEVQ